MGYSYKKLKAELSSKGYADEGLVAWGSVGGMGARILLGGIIGNALGAATEKKYAITKKGTKIAIFPFTNKEILYDKAFAIDKVNIKKAKVGNFLSQRFVFQTNNGKKYSYLILQGKSDVKKILELLEIPRK